jgi:hypothetical protein
MSTHKKLTLTEMVQQHDDAIFGTWSDDFTERRSGLVEQVLLIKKVLLFIIGPLVTISALSALGVPLKFAVPLVEKFIVGFVQH